MSKHRKFLILAFLGTGLSAAAFVLPTYLASQWVAQPPSLPAYADQVRATSLTFLNQDQVLGDCWAGKRLGFPVLYLSGPPYAIGHANGVLSDKLMWRQEEALLDLMNRHISSPVMQTAVKWLVLYQNRNLPEYFSPEWQMELLGLSHGCEDIRPQLGPFYHRLMNYHAAQDISYALAKHPWAAVGCTAMGAWGEATSNGHLIMARNFDWEAAPVFDHDRLLILCEPQEGIPYASLSWGGMIGCVTGMNAEGIGIAVNGAPSILPRDARMPTCMVARNVLQYARTLDEAVEIIRKAETFVAGIFLVGSRRDGKAIAVEKTFQETRVRESGDQNFLVAANHFLTPDLRDVEFNRRFMQEDTSVARHNRARELMMESYGRLDAPELVRILRDRSGAQDTPLGNGHRSSLNPLIATHAAVMDLTRGIFWVAAPPHQLGEFIPFDLNQMKDGKILEEERIEADPLLESVEYKNWGESRQLRAEGWRQLHEGHADQAYRLAMKCEELNPGLYENQWLLGEALIALNRPRDAERALQKALARRPALESETRQIRQLIPGLTHDDNQKLPPSK